LVVKKVDRCTADEEIPEIIGPGKVAAKYSALIWWIAR